MRMPGANGLQDRPDRDLLPSRPIAAHRTASLRSPLPVVHADAQLPEVPTSNERIRRMDCRLKPGNDAIGKRDKSAFRFYGSYCRDSVTENSPLRMRWPRLSA